MWQIWRQHPAEFEFNEAFLLFLVDQTYSQQFGTFLANSERHREALRLPARTVSIWSFINHPSQRPQFTNPLYLPSANKLLVISAAPTKIQFWDGLYNRSEASGATSTELTTKLMDEIVELRQQLHSLKNSTQSHS